MKGEIIPHINAQIYKEVNMPGGDRIIFVEPILDYWPSVDLANHNVFLLDQDNKVVWQVRREDKGYVNFEFLYARIKRPDLKKEEFFDPFTWMSLHFAEQIAPPQIDAEGKLLCPLEYNYFDDYIPGRLILLTTRCWGYELDPETGIATCTGEQQK